MCDMIAFLLLLSSIEIDLVSSNRLCFKLAVANSRKNDIVWYSKYSKMKLRYKEKE